MDNAKNKPQGRPRLIGGGMTRWYLLKEMTFRMSFAG